MTRLPDPAPGAPARPLEALPGPRGLPLLGSLHRWDASRAHLILEDWAREHGPIYRFRLGPQPLVVISEAEAMMTVLRERPHDFRRHFAVRPIFREMGIDGLFSAEGDDWRRQRPLVMRALDPAHLKRFFPVIVTATERLHARWLAAAAAGAPVDLRADLTRYTVDVTCSLAFGTDVATLARDDPDPLQHHLDRIFAGIARRINSLWPTWRWFRTRADREIERSLEAAGRAVHAFVEAAREQMAREPALRESPRNLLQALLAANETARLSDAELHGNVMTLLLAGEDTTANTIAWALHLLSQHPDVLRAARTEALEALGEPTAGGLRPVALHDFEQTRALPLIEGVVLEALRLKPVAPLNMFTAIRDTELMGTRIPARTLVCLLKRPPATDPLHFPRPAEFAPQRWLAGEAAASGAGSQDAPAAVAGGGKRAFMPFGGGPRFCPGRYLALLEAKMVLATTLASFELEPTGAPVTELLGMTMQPQGLKVMLRPPKPHTQRERSGLS
ncbi:MAG TPA: cytochrome P450 [Burkholderiaceae bacterium]|nr:cytochrome P450 [Burkholderiaceae bacterium]